MTACTRSIVSLLISLVFPFSTLETVAMETPDSRAMCLIVIWLDLLMTRECWPTRAKLTY